MTALWTDKDEEVTYKPHYALAKSVPLKNSNSTPKISAFHASLLHSRDLGPVASKHGNLRSLLNAGSMALGSTTGRQRHGVGKGGTRNW